MNVSISWSAPPITEQPFVRTKSTSNVGVQEARPFDDPETPFTDSLEALIYLDGVFRRYVRNEVDWVNVKKTLNLFADVVEHFRNEKTGKNPLDV